eukprot:TRINITY_DN5477_c0_g2_i1.p1 TRINITY_DN5477_c0_g2~~TRINITY_DN5477_c0_g2_i1.p1  ORF type:complete len:313 (-),score=46.05 TRINITY_DN5477_c0_g2_i1:8-946(-)
MEGVDSWLETIKGCKCLPEKQFKMLCTMAKDILIEEPNLHPVQLPVIICGDIHGQFHDLMELFKKGGEMPTKNYIFMGDYVDRGYYSLETMQLLLCLKVRYPDKITLLRGNHESRQVTGTYGFYDEIIHKYGNANPYQYCMEVFDCLGISAIVDGNIFCVHAGLSPSIRTVDQINGIERRVEVPSSGPLCDLVWSDPEEIEGWALNQRGAGWLFGKAPTEEFLHLNDLTLIARSHQIAQEGYKYMFDNKLVIVWSAPNYCYRMGNKATIMEVLSDNPEPKFIKFDSVSSLDKVTDFRKAVPYFLQMLFTSMI